MTDAYLRAGDERIGQSYALAGPADKSDPNLPVRGDLAHIKLAGRYFVPHYAVPMPHRARAATVVRSAERLDADQVAPLEAGARFDVLDFSGGWAWGSVGEDGPVGYVQQDTLEAL